MLSHRFHRFTQMIILHTDDNGYPRIAFIRLTKTTQDKPLAVDANVSASLLCCSRLKILEQAQIFSAYYTITLRVSHQTQGDKPKINIESRNTEGQCYGVFTTTETTTTTFLLANCRP